MIRVILICLFIFKGNMSIDPVLDYALEVRHESLYVWTIEGQNEDYGDWVRLYRNGQLIYENDFSAVNPWCIHLGDIDGDNSNEVLIGTFNKAPFYDIAKRPFVFKWNDEFLSKMWTGSYLGYDELINFYMDDENEDGVDELITMEKNQEGHIVSYKYKWVNFGFTRKKNKIE